MRRRSCLRNPLVPASVVLLALTLAHPASADDFKLGIGGGTTIVTGTFFDSYKSGWSTAVRALWFPSSFFIGVRGAGYYGQNPPKTSDPSSTAIGSSTLFGFDANVAIRLLGKGADGLYVDLGLGSRSLRGETRCPGCGTVTGTESNISYNVGAGFSTKWFFVEANGVYFRVQGKGLVSIPVTFGIQF